MAGLRDRNQERDHRISNPSLANETPTFFNSFREWLPAVMLDHENGVLMIDGLGP
jgi:hypothetical protein